LVCGKSELQKHIKNMNAVNISKPIASYFADKTKQKHNENEKKAEIKLAVLFAEHNVATLTVDHLVPLSKTISIDSKICSDITLGQTKCGQMSETAKAPGFSHLSSTWDQPATLAECA
jgi:hypothetical protein